MPFVRALAVAAAVLVAPAAALACPGEKGAQAAADGACPYAKAEGSCPHAKAGVIQASAGTGACGAHGAKVGKVTVAELSSLLGAKPGAVPVDANSEKTRAKEGVIPGATLLTSSSQFDAAKELPAAKDTHLVFYCANTRCTASKTAADRALEAGYTNVSILPEGIAGWKAAGKSTSVPRS